MLYTIPTYYLEHYAFTSKWVSCCLNVLEKKAFRMELQLLHLIGLISNRLFLVHASASALGRGAHITISMAYKKWDENGVYLVCWS